jgi:Uma2 family endonuclease
MTNRSIAREPAGCMVLLRDVPWIAYQALRRAERNDHLRMTYDGGELEIMSPFKRHGKIATLLDHMIHAWTRHCQVEIESGRDMTCDREDLAKGLEPDLCYWIDSQPLVQGKDEIDWTTDPPPDLALEVDITGSSIPKLPIYEALRIPEVWCWREGLEVLMQDGEYVAVSQSASLPGFPLQLASQIIDARNSEGENALLARFEAEIAELPR